MRERPDIHTISSHESHTASSDSRSVRQILQDIVNHISDIFRSEVRLAKTEVRQDMLKLAKTASFIGIAAVLMLYAVGLVFLSAVYALQLVLPAWLAAILVGVPLGIVAAILFVIGRNRLKQASLRPNQTIQTLEDNVTWFKRRTK
jgi:uncharacterized membrane protein YqjE